MDGTPYCTTSASLENINSQAETTYLLSSPTNAKRLLNAANQLTEGKGCEQELST